MDNAAVKAGSFQIYRFLMGDEVERNGSNVIYEATDTASATSVLLYEWSPPARILTSATAKFAGLADTFEGVEAFSFGSRLYLAGTQDNVRAAMTRLRAEELFTGPWYGLFADPQAAPPPVPPPTTPIKEASVQSKSINGKVVVGFVVLLFVCFILIVLISQIGSERDSAKQNAAGASQQISQLQNENEALKKDVDRLNSDLQREKGRHVAPPPEPQPTPVSAPTSEDASSGETYKLRFRNDCSKGDVSIALHYRNLDGKWVTSGWWVIKPGETAEPVTATAANYYMYAMGIGYTWGGSHDPEAIQAAITDKAFKYEDGQEMTDQGRHTVPMLKRQVGIVQALSCP